MGITDTVFGSPGQTQVHQTAGSKPPGFNFARDFFNSLGGIAQNPYPTYQGQIDPGLSPTLQNLMRQAQGYSQAGPPEIMAGVQGSLGRFMNPSFMNPVARMQQGGAPDYFNQNPNQTVWNGGNGSGLAGVFGGGQLGSKMATGPGGASGGQTDGGYQAGGGASMPGLGGGGMGMGGGFQLPNGQPNQTPPYYANGGDNRMPDWMQNGQSSPSYGSQGAGQPWPMGGGGQTAIDDGMNGGSMSGSAGGSMPMGGMSESPLQNVFSPNGQFPLNPAGQSGPVAWTGPGGSGVMQPGGGQPGQGGGRTFGGYTAQQLQADPSLAGRLGQHASGLWRAFQPGGGQGGPNMMHPTNPGAPRQPGQPGLPTKPNRDPRRGGVAELPGMGLK